MKKTIILLLVASALCLSENGPEQQKSYTIRINSTIGQCKLIIDDSIKTSIPSAITLKEGVHSFHFINDSLDYSLAFNLLKNETLVVNSNLNSFFAFNKVVSSFRFAEEIDHFFIKVKELPDTLSYGLSNYIIKETVHGKSELLISLPGYKSIIDTLDLPPFLIYNIDVNLKETDDLKIRLIYKEEARRKKIKYYSIAALSAMDAFSVYRFFNHKDRSSSYYQDYVNESNEVLKYKLYKRYTAESIRVKETKSLYKNLAITTSAFLGYLLFFEPFTDLSKLRDEISNKISFKSSFEQDNLQLYLGIRF